MKYNKENPLRVITLFSGYDSQCLALDRVGVPYDLVAWCEIDESAIKAHDTYFPQYTDRNVGDITKVDAANFPDCDLITWSFPCTDVSQAGRQAGLSENSGTRSSLAWEAIRIFEAKRPKYLMMENVKALVSQKFIKDYHKILLALEKIGYVTFTDVLNAKNYGVPQNRDRVFGISILITDDDPNPQYFFPKPIPLKVCLADVLEEEVEDKYFLSDEMLARFCEKSLEEEGKTIEPSSDENDEEYFEDEDGFENFFVAQ